MTIFLAKKHSTGVLNNKGVFRPFCYLFPAPLKLAAPLRGEESGGQGMMKRLGGFY